MSSVIEGPPKSIDPSAERVLVPAPDRLYRLSVKQYHEMIDVGLLATEADERVELLDGLLVRKMGKKPRHRIAFTHLRDLLMGMLSGWHVQTQDPISLDISEPEPDLAVIRGVTEGYRDRHPGPQDIGLVIEVSDSTLHEDRAVKKPIYARNGIVEYWIVNLVDEQIEVHRRPTGLTDEPTYASQQDFKRGERVPLTLDGAEVGTIAVADVLP